MKTLEIPSRCKISYQNDSGIIGAAAESKVRIVGGVKAPSVERVGIRIVADPLNRCQPNAFPLS